jgi:hypothetical protein
MIIKTTKQIIDELELQGNVDTYCTFESKQWVSLEELKTLLFLKKAEYREKKQLIMPDKKLQNQLWVACDNQIITVNEILNLLNSPPRDEAQAVSSSEKKTEEKETKTSDSDSPQSASVEDFNTCKQCQTEYIDVEAGFCLSCRGKKVRV